MSFVTDKIQFVRDSDGAGWPICRIRSEFRMKRYGSVLDYRAWIVNREEERMYFLELSELRCRKFPTLGRYIPIGVLVDILVKNRLGASQQDTASDISMSQVEDLVDRLKGRIKDLERELTCLRKENNAFKAAAGVSSPEELCNIRRELETMNKCCDLLAAMQKDNNDLQVLREKLLQVLKLSPLGTDKDILDAVLDLIEKADKLCDVMSKYKQIQKSQCMLQQMEREERCSLESSMNDYKSKMDCAMTQMSDLKSRHEDLKQERDCLKRQLCEYRGTNDELLERMQEMAEDSKAWKSERDCLQNVVDNLRNQLSDMEDRIKEYDSLVKCRMCCERNQDKMDQMQKEIDALTMIEEEMMLLKEHIQNCSRECSSRSLKKSNTVLFRRRICEMAKELVQTKKIAEERVTGMQCLIKAITKKLETIKTELDHEQRVNEELVTRVQCQEQTCENLEQENTILEENNSYFEAAIRNYSAVIENQKERCVELTQELERQKILNKTLKTHLHSLTKTMHIHVNGPVNENKTLCIRVQKNFTRSRSHSPPTKLESNCSKSSNATNNTLSSNSKTDDPIVIDAAPYNSTSSFED